MSEEFISGKDILSFNFYTYGQPFCGSYQGMRYRVQMVKRELPLPEGAEEGAKPEVEKLFTVDVWPEPFAFDVTDKEKIVHTEYPFNEDNYQKVIEYLNEQVLNYK